MDKEIENEHNVHTHTHAEKKHHTNDTEHC